MNAEWPTEERSTPRSSWRAAVVLAVAALVVWKTLPSGALTDPDAKPRTVTARGDLAADEKATIELFERASPSAVYIQTIAVGYDGNPRNANQVQEGSGSGFLWDGLGHVVTNYHVIHAARELEVTLANHEHYPATTVGFEVEKDIAVLRIDAPREELPALAIGTSADLKVGQKVFAIGNPFSLDQTLTAGIISGLGREMPSRFEEEGRGQHPITDLIQTDAAINKGNSGGPLLDSSGRLIGMNTAIVSESGGYSGVGFAIPVDTINRIVTEILKSGKARRPGLGVKIAPDAYAKAHRVVGVVIDEVLPDRPAARAGLQGVHISDPRVPPRGNDIIVAVNGIPVRDSNDLFRELDRHSVGDKVKVGIMRGGRGGKKLELDVELQDLH